MTETAAVLAAIIATGDEKAIAAAYNQLIRDHGHDAAEQIYEDALRQIDQAEPETG